MIFYPCNLVLGNVIRDWVNTVSQNQAPNLWTPGALLSLVIDDRCLPFKNQQANEETNT